MDRKTRLTLSVGVYLAQSRQEAALVQPLERITTYVWTTYYETPGFTSEVIPRNTHAVDKRAPEGAKQDRNIGRQHEK